MHEVPRVSALRYEGDPGDPIEDVDSETDPGVPFPHGDPHGNAYLRQLGQVPPNYKAPPVPWMQQHAPKAALPKARPKRRADEAQPKQRAEVLQPKQRAEAFQRAVAAEGGSIHQAVQREQQQQQQQQQQQGASSNSSTGQQGYQQQQPQGALPREQPDNDRPSEEQQQPATSSQSSTQPVATTQLDEDAEGDGSCELVGDPGGQGPGPQLRAVSLCSSAGAMGSSVTSASTRLVADEGEMGLDLMDTPKGVIEVMDTPKGLIEVEKMAKRAEGQARPT